MKGLREQRVERLGFFRAEKERGIGKFHQLCRQEISGDSKSDQGKGAADSEDEQVVKL